MAFSLGILRPYFAVCQRKSTTCPRLKYTLRSNEKSSRQGLESLTAEEKKHIPPISEIRTDNAAYRQLLLEVYQEHQKAEQGNSTAFERFVQAQVLWDETWAEKIAQFVKANPDYQVVVLGGKGHIIYGYGIPSRVERRLGVGNVKVRSVLLIPVKILLCRQIDPLLTLFGITRNSTILLESNN
ncbi:ChaN family lipoprotein [Microcoleus sp. AR_TQ3_B6]